MIPWTVEAEYVDGYRVFVTFKDGTTGEVDFEGDSMARFLSP